MIRKLILPALAIALLAGCSAYQYRGGASGDYYYGQPSGDYNVYGGYGSSPYGWGGGGYGYSPYGNAGYYAPGYYPPTYYPPVYYPRYPHYPQRPPHKPGPKPGDNNGGNVPGPGQVPDRPRPPWRDLGGMSERAGQGDAGNVLRRREEEGQRAPIPATPRGPQVEQRAPIQPLPAGRASRPRIVAPPRMRAPTPLPAKRIENETLVPL